MIVANPKWGSQPGYKKQRLVDFLEERSASEIIAPGESRDFASAGACTRNEVENLFDRKQQLADEGLLPVVVASQLSMSV